MEATDDTQNECGATDKVCVLSSTSFNRDGMGKVHHRVLIMAYPLRFHSRSVEQRNINWFIKLKIFDLFVSRLVQLCITISIDHFTLWLIQRLKAFLISFFPVHFPLGRWCRWRWRCLSQIVPSTQFIESKFESTSRKL